MYTIISLRTLLRSVNADEQQLSVLRRRLIDPYPCRSRTDALGGLYFARVEILQGVMRMYVEKCERHTISKEIIGLKLGNVSCNTLLLFFISKIYVESFKLFII